MSQIPYYNPSIPLDFKNRKAGLIGFGIVMIIVGALSGCLAILTPIGVAIQARTGAASSSRLGAVGVMYGLMMYATAATGLIWTGIGSIRTQRWVRPIVLIVGTIWLYIGLVVCVIVMMTMSTLPQIMAAQRIATSGPALPQGALVLASIFAIGIVVVFYVALPGILVWYYRGADTQRTLEFYDPVQRWTDRCPLPVLGMSIACVLMAAGMLSGGASGMLFVFGALLTGFWPLAIMIPLAALYGVSSVLIYRRKILGWNLAVMTSIVFQAAMIASAFFYDVQKFGAAVGASPQELTAIRAAPTSNPIFMAISTTITTVAGVIYAIRIRHYFDEGGTRGVRMP